MRPVGYIVITLKILKEGKQWVAHCVELGTSTFGDNFEEAMERIEDAVTLHLNSLEELGESEHFFKEHNISFYPHKPKKDEVEIECTLERGIYSSHYLHPIHKELLGV